MIQRQIGWTALGIGLAQLIPLPFVDDMVSARLLRRLYAQMARHHGVELTGEQRKRLTVSKGGGVLQGCLWAGLRWGVRKLIATMTVVLLVKDVLDEATRGAHQALLVDQAMRSGTLPGKEAEVREALESLLEAEEISPMMRLLKGRENPATDVELEPGLLAALGRGLHRLGGGAILQRRFRRRMAGLPEEE
ncbi:MAG: hypothetical protein VX899_21145 [Myxococcota bacterium]|nr:hypothetical protein [Myxococcota bacterium]